MRARSFSHCGITVSDFNRAVRFYWDVFRCPLVGVSDQPPDRVRAFFGVDAEQPTCKVGWIRVPGGAVLEIFEFRPDQSERSPNGHTFFFVKDFDGNLIELTDLGRMHYVLGLLGPLAGGPVGEWLFRRGRYRRYYEEPHSDTNKAGAGRHETGELAKLRLIPTREDGAQPR